MDNKLSELFGAATNKTAGGHLKWQAFTDDSFRVAIGSGYLHIHRGTTRIDADGDSYPAVSYSAQVTDEQGRVVAEVDATEGLSGGNSQVLSELFEAARKSALKSEHVIDKMLGALRGDF